MPNPPKPTALKVLSGSAAHDPQRLNRAEPKPSAGAMTPPFLPARGPARAAWERIYPVLLRMRVVTEADADALALGCLALAEYLAARRSKGSWRQADAAWKRYVAILREFGMTPSARTRVHAAGETEADPFTAWQETGT